MTHAYDPELLPRIPELPVIDISDLTGTRAVMAGRKEQAARICLPPGVAVKRLTVPAVPGASGVVTAPGAAGGPDVAVVVFTPDGSAPDGSAPDGGTARPALVYMHGGGFVLGDAESHRFLPAQIAAEAGAVVVSVDYRLAPEHPFPAAIEDCYAALAWTARHAGDLGVDPARIGIGGVSAGAGLAAGVALLARDRGGPALCLQLLDVPELDDRLDTPSMREFADTPLWSRPNAALSWRHYLGSEAEGGHVSPYAAPARAADLSGLPPAYVAVCQFDPLRDEGLAYAQRLVQHGVPTEVHLFPGTFHGSAGGVPSAGVSRRMRAELLAAIRRGLAPAQASTSDRPR
jgi:acetyl esterase/lipase